MYTKYLALWLLIVGLCVPKSLGTVRSSYGEECSKTQKCDRKGWLSCHDGICGCAKVDEMHYDEVKGKCVTKSGERCKYGVETEEGSGETSLIEITDCVTNARCAADGLCVCDNEYHEIFNGTCALSSTFGETCSENYECSKAEFLNCLEGTCGCREGSEYSSEGSQCVGLLNQRCVEGQCVEGAECSEESKCSCTEDHYEQGGRCLARKGVKETCTKDDECVHKGLFRLKCQNGNCDCEQGLKYSRVQKMDYYFRPEYENYRGYPEYMSNEFRGPFVEICAPIVGRNCPDGYCVPNSFCEVPREWKISEDRYKYGKCQCTAGLYPDKDLVKCGRPFNHVCSTSNDCTNNLVCNEQRCKCAAPEHQTVFNDQQSCISLIGGRCSTRNQSESLGCVENAECRVSWNRLTGHCRCSLGFVENKEGKCDGEFGTECNYGTNFCDRASNLVCLNNKCSCPDDMYTYNSEVRKCLGLVGAKCVNTTDCVENAYCFQEHPNLPARCACNATFFESENSTCDDVFAD